MTWQSGDDACQAVGGHLGHPSDTALSKIVTYAQKYSTIPVLTGFVAGNIEIPIYAEMCPSNTFYSIVSSTTTIFSNKATFNETCAFIMPSSSKLQFQSCSVNSMVLCDRPLEKDDYCNVVANCSSTTTTFSTTTSILSTTVATTTGSTTVVSTTSGATGSTSSGASTSTGSTVSTGSSTLPGSSVSTQSSSPVSTVSTTSGSSVSTVSSSSVGSTVKPSTTVTSSPGATSTPSKSANNESPVVSPTVTDSTTTVKAGVDPSITTTTPSSCSSSDECLKHQWKIFGMCVDWRAMLGLLLLFLLLLLFFCVCHCCLNACMWCTVKKKNDKVHSDPVIQPPRVYIPPSKPGVIDYDVEKNDAMVLPPAAIQPEPVIVTVPERHESVYGFHTKEIIHMLPEKPETRDIGVNTDPIVQDASILPVVAPLKKKKAIKRPKRMFIPSTITPMDDIEEDAAAEVPLDIRNDSPGAQSIAPLGDAPDVVAPVNFTRNAKPLAPEPKPHNDSFGPKMQSPQKPNNDEFDPRGLRSPPIAQNDNREPRKMTFSPIQDDSEDDQQGHAIPSPPRERKAPNNSGFANTPNDAPAEPAARPTLRNKRLNEPTPELNPSPKPPQNDGPQRSTSSSAPVSNNPFANLGSTPAPENPQPRMSQDDIGMRAARGKLGGAVKGGGGGGEAPNGWKPWANKK